MPLFEYRCDDCAAKFSLLVGMTADSKDPECPKCGSANARKLVSRFLRIRSEDEKLDSLEDAAMGDMDNPAAMGKLMREMGKDLGEDGEDMDEYLDEAERELYDGEAAEDES
jgi:putative FmdB family regulatory protein